MHAFPDSNSAHNWLFVCQFTEYVSVNNVVQAYNIGESFLEFIDLAPVVQKLDSAFHPINHYPADKY